MQSPTWLLVIRLGEFSALVANGVLSFEDALRLVSIRASAMQKACELTPSTMAAVLAMEDGKVEAICAGVQEETGEVVVPANFNCPGQLVISGSVNAVTVACEKLKAAGAKRALLLPVGGAFHSPLMAPAKEELAAAIESVTFNTPTCPVYQNVTATAVTDPDEIKKKPGGTIDRRGAVDAECTSHDTGWGYPIYRGRTGQSIAGAD